MVKRKANVHIEDWLVERASPALTDNGPTVPVEEELAPTTVPVPFPIVIPASPPVAPNGSVSEVTAGSKPVEPGAPAGDDVAFTHEEVAEWFWALLAKASYEPVQGVTDDTRVDNRTG